jgi:HlyD family secretion protein
MSTRAQPTCPPRTRSRRAARAAGVFLIAGLAVGGAFVAAGAGRQGQRQPERSGASAATSMDLFEVARGDFVITTTATGELRAKVQTDVRNQLEQDTTIVEIVPEGSNVRKGDVLIKLNAERVQTAYDEEKLQVENARSALIQAEEAYQIQISENESSLRAANLKLDLARLDLEKWKKGEVESKRQQLDRDLERATKDEERLRERVEKSRALEEKGYYSKDKLKQDELEWERAQAALEKAKLDKSVYWEFENPRDEKQKTSNVEEAEAELDRVKRQNASRLASKEADLNSRKQAMAIRDQKFKKYAEQLEATTVKAPTDGLVVYASSIDNARWGGDEGPFQVGSRVFPNQNLVVLPDTSEMVAVVRVHESLAGRIRPGQNVSVKVDAAGEKRYTGTVESIGILAEQTNRWMDPNLREYSVRINLEIPESRSEGDAVAAAAAPGGPGSGKPGSGGGHGLKPSMRCEAEIQLGKASDVLHVPIQAVFNEGMMRFVHIAEGGKFARRPVQLGQRSDRFAEVRAGLVEGETVLIRRPEPGEVINRPWEEKELQVVGLKLNEAGVVVPVAGAGGPPGGGRRPGGRPPAGDAPTPPAAATPATTPAATTPAAPVAAPTPAASAAVPAGKS